MQKGRPNGTTKCRKGTLSDFLRAQTKTTFLTPTEFLIEEGNCQHLKKTTRYTNKYIFSVQTCDVKVVTDDDETTNSACPQLYNALHGQCRFHSLTLLFTGSYDQKKKVKLY